MAITKKLSKHGNSYALVIERSVLDLLGINGETLLHITTPDGNTIVITPAEQEITKTQADEASQIINKKYQKTLKRLAE